MPTQPSKPAITLKKGKADFTSDFDFAFGGSSWGDAKPVVIMKPVEAVIPVISQPVEVPALIEEKP